MGDRVGSRPDAVVLLGHGSVAAESGVAMFRHASLLQARGVASHVTAGFLNLSEPSIDASAARCVAAGARTIAIVPYFLVGGKYVREDVPRVLERLRRAHPRAEIEATRHLGDHPLLAEIVRDRVGERWGRPLSDADAVVMLAHGSPYDDANDDARRVAARVASCGMRVDVGFMEINRPTIADAIERAVARSTGAVVAVPYFLHVGMHVRHDLPDAVGREVMVHPDRAVLLAEHLGYDSRIATILEDRTKEIVRV